MAHPNHPIESPNGLHATLSGYLRTGLNDEAIALRLATRFKAPYAVALALAVASRAFNQALAPFQASLLKSPPLPKIDQNEAGWDPLQGPYRPNSLNN